MPSWHQHKSIDVRFYEFCEKFAKGRILAPGGGAISMTYVRKLASSLSFLVRENHPLSHVAVSSVPQDVRRYLFSLFS